MRRWIAILPLAVLAALGVLFATFGLHHDPHVNPAALVGKPLPDRSLPPLFGGAPVALKNTVKRADPGQCVRLLVRALRRGGAQALNVLKSEGARVVGVAYKNDPAETKVFLTRYGDPFTTVLVDRDGSVGVDLGVSGVPETYLVSGFGPGGGETHRPPGT